MATIRIPRSNRGYWVSSNGTWPSLDRVEIEERYQRIRDLTYDGRSLNQIAEAVGCSSRTVSRVQKKLGIRSRYEGKGGNRYRHKGGTW